MPMQGSFTPLTRKLKLALAARFTPVITRLRPLAPRPALVTEMLSSSGACVRAKFVFGVSMPFITVNAVAVAVVVARLKYCDA